MNETGMSSRFYIAEMITHNFIFKGVGYSREEARAILLNAWTVHRTELLLQYPNRAAIIPDETKMEEVQSLVSHEMAQLKFTSWDQQQAACCVAFFQIGLSFCSFFQGIFSTNFCNYSILHYCNKRL